MRSAEQLRQGGLLFKATSPSPARKGVQGMCKPAETGAANNRHSGKREGRDPRLKCLEGFQEEALNGL